MATREEVLAAYAGNRFAEANPSEEAIRYWMNTGLGSFDQAVSFARRQNPDLAAQIDAERDLRRVKIVEDAYKKIGRTRLGTEASQIEPEGYNFWLDKLRTGQINETYFDRFFDPAVAENLRANPTAPVSEQVAQYRPFQTPSAPPAQAIPPSTGLIAPQPVTPATPLVPGTTVVPRTPTGPQPSTFANNFSSYVGLPLGGQYNPNMTAGGASPYSMLMARTPAFTNPYAGVVAGLPLGGFNPNIYDRADAAALAAAATPWAAAAGMPGNNMPIGGAGGASGADGGGDSTGNAAAAAAAGTAGSSAGASGGQGGTGIGEGGGTGMGGYAMGGLVDRVAGPNPVGPDDGASMLHLGEHVIKKSSVKKYGQGLLDMINEGKIPAKKMKSLLG